MKCMYVFGFSAFSLILCCAASEIHIMWNILPDAQKLSATSLGEIKLLNMLLFVCIYAFACIIAASVNLCICLHAGDGAKRLVANTIFVVNAIVEYLYTSCVGNSRTVDIVFQVEIVFLAFFTHMVAEYGRNAQKTESTFTKNQTNGISETWFCFMSCSSRRRRPLLETVPPFFYFHMSWRYYLISYSSCQAIIHIIVIPCSGIRINHFRHYVCIPHARRRAMESIL